MKILVTGCAGFIGTNLCNKLMMDLNNEVWGIDNFISGRVKNLSEIAKGFGFRGFFNADIRDDMPWLKEIKFDRIYNLACPASPPFYQRSPITTTLTCTEGMYKMLRLADSCGARILQTSTSEVYGDPDITPQPESYRGNVSCTGIRSCYDEGKRCAESLCFNFQRLGADVRVARIFNTYGEHMRIDDGRVLTNMVGQALRGGDITIYGDGSQTRSFCHVEDTVNGLIALMESSCKMPINIGNPDEHTIEEMAQIIKKTTGSKSKIVYLPLPQDDPKQRRPDISMARMMLGWEPKISLQDGLDRLISYLKKEI